MLFSSHLALAPRTPCTINKVLAFADHLNGADITILDGDIVMTLFGSLPPSYEYLVVAMELAHSRAHS